MVKKTQHRPSQTQGHFGGMVDALLGLPLKVTRDALSNSDPALTVIDLSGGYKGSRHAVLAAMLFPRNENLRHSYCLRNVWFDRLQSESQYALAAADVQAFLNVASRHELRVASDAGARQGPVAGDLLGLVYQQVHADLPWPSMREAVRQYQIFAKGRTYGDGLPLKRSNGQIRTYFEAAAPAAHLWAARRIIQGFSDGGKAYQASFTAEAWPYFLGVAKELQEFATTFIPKGSKPAKPIICRSEMLLLPDSIKPIRPF